MKLSDLPKLKPLIEAVEMGETIQWRCPINGWVDLDDDEDISGTPDRFRIKPKPREFYLVMDTLQPDRLPYCYRVKQSHLPVGVEQIKVREVLDD